MPWWLPSTRSPRRTTINRRFLRCAFKDGRYLRINLKLKVNNIRFNFAHDPGVGHGTRAWTEGNAFQAVLKSLYFKAAEGKKPLVNYWVRAHKHRYLHRYWEGDYGRIDGLITPAFQARTHWVKEKINHSSISDLGMVYFWIDKDGQHKFEVSKTTFEETAYEEA